jgi:hypothetical protein
MPKCENCGNRFDVDDARSEHDAFDDWAGELLYDDSFPEHSICGSCAINDSLENVGAGRAWLFSMETGRPPEEMPDGWTPSADGGIAPW